MHIFDNAADLKLMRHAWPHDAQGSILLTSRYSNLAFSPAGGGFHIQPFNDSEGSSILLRLTNVDPGSLVNPEIAKRITHTLGELPLAPHQIGGLLNQRKIPLIDILPLYERNANETYTRMVGITDSEHSLSTVWEVYLT